MPTQNFVQTKVPAIVTRTGGSLRRGRGLVLIAGLAMGVVGFGVSGCDSRSPTAKAVEEASRQLSVLTTSGSRTPSVELGQKQYKKVTETLRDVLDEGLPQERAAALVLTAQAKLGLAAHAAGEAAAAERESLNRATVVRGLLGAWNSHSSRAAATEGYDPSAVIEDFRKQALERDAQAAGAEALRSELSSKIAGLRAEIKAKADSAAAAENSYAALKSQAVTVSATVAEGIVKQAAESKRQADALRMDAALVTARTDQLEPQAREAELQVSQFKNQKQTLESMASQLKAAYEESKKEAAGARSDANAVAVLLEKSLTELRAQREDVLNKAFDSAAAQFADAASAARKATGDENGASKLVLGAAKQSAGDLQWSRAHGQRAYADLLRSLAASKPGLANREKYLAEAGEVEKAMKDSAEAAKAAYEEARAAYTSAKATGEAKERLQNLGSILEKMPDLIDGKIPNLSAAMAAIKKSEAGAEEAPAAAPAGEVAADDAGGLGTAVDAVLLAMNEKRMADLRGMMHFAAGYEAMGDGIVRIGGAYAKLDEACKAKFGTGADELMKGMGGAGGMGGMQMGSEAWSGKKAADLEVKAEGETGTATLPGTAQTMHFVKIDGAWKFDLQMEKTVPAEAMAQAMTMFGPMAEGFEALAGEVEAGKFNNIEAVKVGLMQKFQAVMGALQQGGGGG